MEFIIVCGAGKDGWAQAGNGGVDCCFADKAMFYSKSKMISVTGGYVRDPYGVNTIIFSELTFGSPFPSRCRC